MRIAIFSDVHGNLAALRAVMAALEQQHPLQLTIVAGDLAGPGGARPVETLDLLFASDALLLLGNHDRRLWDPEGEPLAPGPLTDLAIRQERWMAPLLGERRIAALQRLPRSLRLSPAPGQDLLVVHSNAHDLLGGHAAKLDTSVAELRERYGGTGARVIAFGHYHEPLTRSWEEGLLVNVASVSLPSDQRPLAAYSILTWDGVDWRVEQYRIPYDAAEEEAALAASDIPR